MNTRLLTSVDTGRIVSVHSKICAASVEPRSYIHKALITPYCVFFIECTSFLYGRAGIGSVRKLSLWVSEGVHPFAWSVQLFLNVDPHTVLVKPHTNIQTYQQ